MTRAADLAKLIAGGGTITVADNSDTLILESTDADANDGPLLSLSRDSSSPADGDLTGKINFNADNDAGQVTAFSSIRTFIRDASDGTEDGAMQLNHMLGGSEVTAFEIDNDEYVINQGSNDVDFRVESNGNANMLVIDGGNDVMSIGRAINTASTVSIQNKDDANNNTLDLYNDNGNRTISMQQDTTGNAKLILQKNDGTNAVRLDANLGGILFGTDTAQANTLNDYEEGTWSPSHATGAGSGSFSASNYTKIGKLVHLVTSFAFSSGSGTLGIGNLPFTASSAGVGISREDAVNGYSAHVRITSGTTTMELYGTQSTGNPSGYQTTSGTHRISLTYFTDS